MNPEALELWRQGVLVNCQYLESILFDRMKLKNDFASHLKDFFDYDKIVFSNDFSVITLKWEYGHFPVIDNDCISKLGFDWSISTDFSDDLGQGVVVTIHPFGLGED